MTKYTCKLYDPLELLLKIHKQVIQRNIKKTNNPIKKKKIGQKGFSGGPEVMNLSAVTGHMGLIPGPGRSHMP